MRRKSLPLTILLAALLAIYRPTAGRAQTYNVIYSFTVPPAAPAARLFKSSDGKLYGTTQRAGALSNGAVFQVDTSGSFATLHTFATDEGSYVQAPVVQATDGSFYGMSVYGGAAGNGAIFKVNTAGSFTLLHSFGYGIGEGANPYGGLIQATDGNFYGTTEQGGDVTWGVVFKMDSAGTVTVLHSFSGADGVYPFASLVQGTDGKLYGTTRGGGTNSLGTTFRIDTSGSNFTTLHSFAESEGVLPSASLIQASDGKFYGTTHSGAGGHGSVFKMDTAGNVTVLHSFTGTDGDAPDAALVQGTDGKLYGVTAGGGSSGNGTLFRIDTTGSNFTTLHNFAGSDGSEPLGGLTQAADGNFYGTTSAGGTNGGGTYFRMVPAGTVTTLFTFGATSPGYEPNGDLVQGTDGMLYGSTYLGGSPNDGSIFKTDTSGNLSVIHSFTGSDGADPIAKLFQGSDGLFYGMTTNGGTNDAGAAFKVTSTGTVTTLHSFNGTDGVSSNGGLLQGADGKYYGAMYGGGSHGFGTVFRIDSTGANFTTLHDFNLTDGASPRGSLIQISGTFYGTTESGGANPSGTVYKMTAAGVVTTLHSFNGTDGDSPFAGLILASDGKLYGTTFRGGANQAGAVFRIDTSGSNFATLHSFNGTDGSSPFGGVIQGADGAFYGTTSGGGAHSRGTIFKMDSAGSVTTLHSFTEADGDFPAAGLVQASDGKFYGTTNLGGAGASGVVFRLAICTPPSPPVAGNNGPVCVGQTLHLTASTVAGATYTWTGPNGFTSALQNPSIASVTAAAAGTYSVTVTVGGCTSAPAMTTVVINPLPSATITAPAIVVADSTGNVASVPDAGSGGTYSWGITNGTITAGSGTKSITFTAGASGSVGLSVTVHNGAGCVAPGSTSVPIIAKSARVFVSTTGANSNNCSNPLTPCVDFAGALAQVLPGGEVIALATGPYGPLTITQPVTISGPPGIVIYSGHQVTLNAPGATVVLRGITIDGTGANENGINVVAVGALHVESCVIANFGGTGNGILFGSSGQLFVKDTIVRGNANVGIWLNPASGSARASIDHCRLEGNGLGISCELNTAATVRGSVLAGSLGTACEAEGGSSAELNIERSLIANNGSGISANGGTVRVSNSTITDNGTGLISSGGSLLSRSNNTVEGNGINGTFTGTYSAK